MDEQICHVISGKNTCFEESEAGCWGRDAVVGEGVAFLRKRHLNRGLKTYGKESQQEEGRGKEPEQSPERSLGQSTPRRRSKETRVAEPWVGSRMGGNEAEEDQRPDLQGLADHDQDTGFYSKCDGTTLDAVKDHLGRGQTQEG